MQRIFMTATLLASLCFVGAAGGQAQTDDPYAARINTFIQGTHDAYEHVRRWQSMTYDEQDAATHGVTNALNRLPGLLSDMGREAEREHPENVHRCDDEPTMHLRNVCSFYEADTLRTEQMKRTNPEYVRGQISMLRRINNCEIPRIRCF